MKDQGIRAGLSVFAEFFMPKSMWSSVSKASRILAGSLSMGGFVGGVGYGVWCLIALIMRGDVETWYQFMLWIVWLCLLILLLGIAIGVLLCLLVAAVSGTALLVSSVKVFWQQLTSPPGDG